MAEQKANKDFFIGIDTGGTFTDVTVIDKDGKIITSKAFSTPPDFSLGIINSLTEAAKKLGISLEEFLSRAQVLAHGMTVATNTIINRSGVKTGLITTKGFEDTILIMKVRGKCLGLPAEQVRHQSVCSKPEPIVPKNLIRGVTERMDRKGQVIVSLNLEEARNIVKNLVEEHHVEAIAICTLWSFINPKHELEIENLIREEYPGVAVSRSSAVSPTMGEYERTVTTVFNAYLMPETKRYLTNLRNNFQKMGTENFMIMQAWGGSATAERIMDLPVYTISSGPAGGVIGSVMLGEILGHRNIITTDVGGTSFDVGLIMEGNPMRRESLILDQYSLKFPIIDVVSIGAAGGSVIQYDDITHTMKVGPQSMGGNPGPVCYDLGGNQPTLTDADLVLGILDPVSFYGGRKRLNKEKALQALGRVGSRLGLDVYQTARGARSIACSHMADLIQSQVTFRGYDPRECVVFAYGGGGPEYGAEYGMECKAKEIIMFPHSPTLSALGIAASDIASAEDMTCLYSMPAKPDELTKFFEELEAKVVQQLAKEGFDPKSVIVTREAQLCYRRQVNYLGIDVKPGKLTLKDVERIADDFEKKYERLYGQGSRYKRAEIQLVNLRVYAVIKSMRPVLAKYRGRQKDPSRAYRATRDVYLTDSFVKTPVFDWSKLAPNNVIEGPAIIEAELTTALIPSGMKGIVDKYLNISISLS